MGTSVRMIEKHYGTLLESAHAGIATRLAALEAKLEQGAEAEAGGLGHYWGTAGSTDRGSLPDECELPAPWRCDATPTRRQPAPSAIRPEGNPPFAPAFDTIGASRVRARLGGADASPRRP
jgi:hypothetical protein